MAESVQAIEKLDKDDKKNASAYYKLAEFFENGYVVEKSGSKAIECYKKINTFNAFYHIFKIFKNGCGDICADPKRALDLLEKIVDYTEDSELISSGKVVIPSKTYLVVNNYSNRIDVRTEKGFSTEDEYKIIFSARGPFDASYELAKCYEKGYAGKYDIPKAAVIYQILYDYLNKARTFNSAIFKDQKEAIKTIEEKVSLYSSRLNEIKRGNQVIFNWARINVN